MDGVREGGIMMSIEEAGRCLLQNSCSGCGCGCGCGGEGVGFTFHLPRSQHDGGNAGNAG